MQKKQKILISSELLEKILIVFQCFRKDQCVWSYKMMAYSDLLANKIIMYYHFVSIYTGPSRNILKTAEKFSWTSIVELNQDFLSTSKIVRSYWCSHTVKKQISLYFFYDKHLSKCCWNMHLTKNLLILHFWEISMKMKQKVLITSCINSPIGFYRFITGSLRTSLLLAFSWSIIQPFIKFISWWDIEGWGKRSGCFMIIWWPISLFVYQWH